MFTVTVAEKEGQTEVLNFEKTEISIGRVKGNDIVLPKGNVSKRHSRIVIKDGKFIVVDLKSTNGTYVNGRKITSPQVIKSADKVYIGDFILSVTESAGEASVGSPSGVSESVGASPSSGIQPLSDGFNANAGGPGLGAPPAGGGLPGPGLGGGRPGSLGNAPAVRPPEPVKSLAGTQRTPTVSASNMSPGKQALGRHGAPPASGGLPGPGLGGAAMGLGGPPPGGGLSSPGLGGAPSNGLPGPGLGGSAAGLGGASSNGLPGPGLGGVPASPSSRPLGGDLNNAGRHPNATPPRSPEGAPVSQSAPKAGAASSVTSGSSLRSSLGSSAAPGLALYTPGAVTVPPKPEFVSQRDESFAELQGRAAELFFSSIDPQTLPMYYPARPEDRGVFEQVVNDIAAQLGGGQPLADHLMAEATGLGPLESLLDDQSIEEIYVNTFNQILYRQEGRVVSAPRAYSHPEFLYLAAQRLLSARAEESAGDLADEVRFSDGTRVHILMPPLAPRGPVLTVRKARHSVRTLEDLVQSGTLDEKMAEMLRQAVEAGRSVLVAGPTEGARAQVLGALAALIPEGTRMMVLEQVSGLRLPQQSAVYMEESAGGHQRYDMRAMMRASMRMSPERVVVNALSGAEAYDWVSAAAGGTIGSMAACAGVHTRDALARLQTLCQLGAPDLSHRALREQIARAAHVVVVVHQGQGGSPHIHQISEVQGIDLDNFRVQDVFYHKADASGGQFVATGYVPMFYEALRSAGLNADTRIFNV